MARNFSAGPFLRAVAKYDNLIGSIDPTDPKCPNRKAWKWVEIYAVNTAFDAVSYMTDAGLLDVWGKLTEKGIALLPSKSG